MARSAACSETSGGLGGERASWSAGYYRREPATGRTYQLRRLPLIIRPRGGAASPPDADGKGSMTSVLVLFVGALGAWAGSILFLRLPGPVARPVPDRWHRKST